MDTKMNSLVTFLTLILLISLLVSEARPLLSPLQGKEGVNGVFRTLKGAGPSPGIGHRLKKLQIIGEMKDSGPSSGGVGHIKLHNEGQKFNTVQVIGVIKHSGPSPGEGHKYITSNNHS
jgi:hypothetical protein